MIYLVEVDAWDPAAGAVTTLRYGTVGYVTAPGDAPAHAFYDPRVQQPGNYERHTFAPGTTNGQATAGAGQIVLANPDGVLDGLLAYGFDGRAVRVYGLASVDAPFASRALLFRGTLEQPEFSWTRLTLRVRDRLAQLQVALQTVLYAGTTTSGGKDEAEGRPDDLKGQPKPLLFGRARGIPAVMPNAFDLILQVSSRAIVSVEAVYDRGVLLTATSDYATVPALRAATIGAGKYATCLAAGLVRLGSAPAGQVTVDATEGTVAADRSAARVAQRILLQQGGLAAGDLGAAAFDALHAANPAPVGAYFDTTAVDVLAAVTGVLSGIGAFLVPDRLGVFQVGRVEAPSAAAAAYSDIEVLDRGQGIERLATEDEGRGVPAWKVTVQYARNHAPQSATDLDQVNASAAYKAFATEEYRSAVASDPAVKAAHPLAPELVFAGAFTSEADALAEAARLLALYKVRRDRFSVPVKAEFAQALDLGRAAQLTLPRFGLSAGKPFLTIGMTEDFGSGVTTLDLWG